MAMAMVRLAGCCTSHRPVASVLKVGLHHYQMYCLLRHPAPIKHLRHLRRKLSESRSVGFLYLPALKMLMFLLLLSFQGASVMMAAFEKHFDRLQSAILERECDPKAGTDCACGAGQSLYRCQDCFTSTVSCQQCLLRSHTDLPLHHIQHWTGTHFERTNLGDLGLILCLGHATLRCPNAPTDSKERPTVIVHTNGIHKLDVEYCYCAYAADEPTQLASAGLFPATTEKPETAFTFAVLKEFHAHTLSSKKSAYDYYIALQKLTNNAFPDRTYVSILHA